MAKLPYTYTICPDQEAPKQFTASCKDMGELLRHSPNGDLTINQPRTATWDAWSGNHMGLIEETLHAMAQERKHDKG
jgi:hypothetical protein